MKFTTHNYEFNIQFFKTKLTAAVAPPLPKYQCFVMMRFYKWSKTFLKACNIRIIAYQFLISYLYAVAGI